MKKRLLSWLLIFLLVSTCIFSGCGSTESGDDDNDELADEYVDEAWKPLYDTIMKQTNEMGTSDPVNFSSYKVDEKLPAYLDLREKGVVTPIRNQGEFGTCWAFGTSAAAEISILSSMNLTASEFEKMFGVPVTLSTKHLAYFSLKHLPAANEPDYKNYNRQDGEGYYFLNNKKNKEYIGNYLMGAIISYACGTGPVLEADFPYCPNNYTKASFFSDLMNEKIAWKNADWSIDENYRFKRCFELTSANELPTPIFKRNTSDGKVEYEYRDLATKIIKSELVNGRGVAISYKADVAMQGAVSDNTFLNVSGSNPTYAQYVDDPTLSSDHVVCIVGYDDNYSVDNFLPNHRPPHNGAFICKNSWGGKDGIDELDKGDWGYNNSGYFYLSYYDMSINYAFSYGFDSRIIKGTNYDVFIDGYDFLSSFNDINCINVNKEVKMANVYSADSDMTLRSVSALTGGYNSNVTYTVYKLNDNYQSPEDGEALITMSMEYDYPGYHRSDLTKSIFLEKGQKYSVVEKIVNHTPNGDLHEIIMNCANSTQEAEKTTGDDAGNSYSVINSGESYLYNEGYWKDEVNMLNEMESYLGELGFVFDNFPIKVYIDVK